MYRPCTEPRRRLQLVAALFVLCSAFACPLARADVVVLNNGDRVSGKIESMTDGKLTVATPWGDKVTIRWDQVAQLHTDATLPLHLEDGTVLEAAVDPGDKERIVRVKTATVLDATRIELGKVVAINPPARRPIRYTGNLTFGGNIRAGNTRTTSVNAAAEFIARAKRLRLTLRGAWNYTQDRALDELTARSARASVKLDFFVSEKFYTYAQASFLGDKFRDFNLQATFGLGAGYQWVESEHLNFSTEAGISYVNEDRRTTPDERRVTARIAWDFDWDIVVGQVVFFHNGELFPSLEETQDFFLNTQTGMRFTIWKGFYANAQINYQYDGLPAAGFRRFDVAYIFGLGYGFDL